MSIAAALAPSGPVTTFWRPLGPDLWVGRSDAGPVGTIERGRRFVATDADGRRCGGFRTLDTAMAAFDVRQDAADAAEPRSWEALVLVTTLAGAAGSLLAIYALIGI